MSLRNWRVRRKLGVVVVVPSVALLVASGLAVQTQVVRAREAGAVQDLAVLGQRVTSLVQLVQRERDVTAGWVARGRVGDPAELAGQRAAVDVAVGSYLDAAEQLMKPGRQAVRLLATAENRIRSLPVLRQAVTKTALPAEAAFAVYSSVIGDLLALIGEIGRATGDRALAEPVRALDAVARTKEFASQERGLLYAILSSLVVSPAQWHALVAAVDQERAALAEFRSVATPEQRRRFEDAVTGSDVDRVERIKAAAVAAQNVRILDADADTWLKAATIKLDLMAGVEAELLEDLGASSAVARSDTLRGSAATIGWTLGVVLVACGAMLLMVRSLAGRLDQLRGGALEVANQRLPAAIAGLAETDLPGGGQDVETVRVRPIGVAGSDEVGEVARAFDAVHTEALRLGREQAVLRRSLNAIFINLARRSQSLVERLLQLLDDFERGEEDPDRLRQLFAVDHLATRMRRHDESLLVLAGADSPRRRAEPAALGEVLRAAVAEIEDYTRVDCVQADDINVVGYAVTDIIHLIAELLENATWFSPDSTRVTIAGKRMPHEHGVIVEIADSGIGMQRAEMDEANARLAAPPAVDAAASKEMGLYVVGRLAVRHGITVQLRRARTGGVMALIQLPAERLVEPAGAAVRDVTGIAALPDDRPMRVRSADALVDSTVELAMLTPHSIAARADAVVPGEAGTAPATPFDQAWRGAIAQSSHVSAVSASGLPVRRPMANAVPGNAGRHAMPDPAPPSRRLALGGLARFQAAVESGRAPADTGHAARDQP